MTPELVGLLDKISFTGALLFAVYVLYRDARSDEKIAIAENSKNINKLTEQIALLSGQVTQLGQLVQLMLEYEQRHFTDEPTRPLPPMPKMTPPGGIGTDVQSGNRV